MSYSPHDRQSGLVSWFANNSVAANLLMIFLIVGGILGVKSMKTEVFPIVDPKMITISVPFPGASPSDIEEAITQPVEESIIGVQGIKRVASRAIENIGVITIELEENADTMDAYNDIKNQIDRITNFPPKNAERPIITRVKPRNLVIKLALFGDIDNLTLRQQAETLEQHLLALPQISDVAIQGGGNREISVLIDRETMLKYQVTPQHIAQQISNSSVNIPAGRIETSVQDYVLRVQDKRYFAKDYADIVIKTLDNGSRLTLGDIAVLEDGFDDKRIYTRYKEKNGIFISVFKNENQDVLEIEKSVQDLIKELPLPDGTQLEVQFNRTDSLKDRMNLMTSNAISGFILLFISLLLFLDLKLALWISIGIPVSTFGGLFLASFFGITLNMISLFAMIIVFGVLVDDAIVVGENIYYEQETYPERSASENIYYGVKNVMAPALMGVLTTIVAFIPMLFTEGDFGQILGVIPVIVICMLVASLIETFLILPSHLKNPTRYSIGAIKTMQTAIDLGLNKFINTILVPTVKLGLRYRYVAITAVIGSVVISLMLVKNGIIRTVFFPIVESSQVTVSLEMPIDTSFERTYQTAEYIYKKAEETIHFFEKKRTNTLDIHQNMILSVGETVSSGGSGGETSQTSQNIATIEVKLSEPDDRNFSSLEFEKKWRELTGIIPQAKSVSFTSSLIRSSSDLQIELSSRDSKTLKLVSAELTDQIQKIQGVVTIKDTFEPGKKEFRFTPTQAGYATGLTPALLGQQLRSYFNGNEALRIRRGRSDIRVMVRFTKQERQTLATLENFLIELPNGQKAPLKEMAHITQATGDAEINRVNGRQIISVIGDVDETIRTTDQVNQVIDDVIIPQLRKKYSDFSYSYEGSARDRQQDTASLKRNTLLAIIVIFALIAVQLKGYLMPLIIVSIIPVGLSGAIYGHWLLGYDLSFMSFFGIVALTGVVVNDSIVLLDYYNKLQEQGLDVSDALIEATKRRFRPIMLTSLTTSISTFPMILETSTQAQFLIPMAVSVSCGILYTTFVLFVFSPPLMLIFDDLSRVFCYLKIKTKAIN